MMRYKPLNKDEHEIRLLRIHSAHSPNVPDVQCDITSISLDTIPDYVALSYCWGSTKATTSITINGERFDVRSNLFDALLRLRDLKIETVWIDAICIDQQNILEKSHQIELMRLIYSRARSVIAWLGLDDQAGTVAHVMNDLKTGAQKFANPSALTQLTSFLQRDYWTRVWIIQEITLAKELTLHCGRSLIPWINFSEAFKEVIKEASLHAQTHTPEFTRIKTLLQLQKELREPEEYGNTRLLPTLFRTCTAEASDSRDKIYGLLDLARDADHFLANPDYNPKHTVEHLCRELTLGIISWKESLDIITLLGRGCHDASFTSGDSPSWAPKLHQLSTATQRRQMALYEDRIDAISQSRLYAHHKKIKAAGDTRSNATQQDKILKCEALRVGDIVFSSLTSHELEKSRGQPDAATQVVPELGNQNPYGNNKSVSTAVANLIFCNCTTQVTYAEEIRDHLKTCFDSEVTAQLEWSWRGLADRYYYPELRRLWASGRYFPEGLKQSSKGWVDHYRSLRIYGRTLGDWVQGCRSRFDAVKDFHRATGRYHKGGETAVERYVLPDITFMIEQSMRLVVLESGLLGWAPKNAQVNDSVYILKGSRFPVILRSTVNGLAVVGDAYIQGIMAGELVQEPASVVWEMIGLC